MPFTRWTSVVVFGLTTGWLAPASAQQNREADSLVLERTVCFGTCPAYRLRVSRDGGVFFQSRNPGDSTIATDSVVFRTLADLVRLAQAAGVFALPSRIMDDRRICADVATDHPTVTIKIFGNGWSHIVEDYHGCFQSVDHSLNVELRNLRRFEVAVDSALGSARWVRPSRRPRPPKR